jgi:hypothetical protein
MYCPKYLNYDTYDTFEKDTTMKAGTAENKSLQKISDFPVCVKLGVKSGSGSGPASNNTDPRHCFVVKYKALILMMVFLHFLTYTFNTVRYFLTNLHLFQEPEAKGPAPWGQSAGGFGGLPHFENRFGGGGMFQPPPFPPQRSPGQGGLTNGTNNPNVIVVDTNQLTTR